MPGVRGPEIHVREAVLRYAIVGGGIAGVTAARRLRALAPKAEILIFEQEPQLYYLRPGLIDLLAGEKKPAELTPFDRNWYESHGISFRPSAQVVELDPGRHTLTLSGGEKMSYAGLILATGADAFRPPVPGASLPGTLTLRSLQDALEIRERAQGARAALVLGGGWLGLETARALRAWKLEVTVVERAPWLLPRQLDRAGGEVLATQLNKLGIEVITGTSCQELRGDGEVREAILTGGRRLPVQLVVIAAGIRPRLGLARQAGLAVNRGVVVDDWLATSAEGVYACGDVAEWQGKVFGIVPAAREQGQIAAANVVEPGSARYRGTVVKNRLKVAGVELVCLGDTQPEGGPGEEHRYASPQEGVYRKLVLRGGKLVGAIVMGDLSGLGEVERLISAGEEVGGELKRLLTGRLG